MMLINYLRPFKIFKRFDGEIGLEIETETLLPYDVPKFHYWSSHVDGSLRNFGMEYILKQPLKFKDEFPAALGEFKERTSKIPFIKDSFSTSVHTHLNFLNESGKTLANFLTTYVLYENLLIRYSGPDRLSNLFCLPVVDAEETYTNIVRGFKVLASSKSWKGFSFNENQTKYAALNLSALFNYGSMEVRSFRGETDIASIQKWVSILYSILTYARRDISPIDIISSYRSSPKKLIEEVFGNYRGDIKHKDEVSLVDRNLWYAKAIAFSHPNWSVIDAKKEVPVFKPTAKILDSYSFRDFGMKYSALDAQLQEYIFAAAERDHLEQHGVRNDGPIQNLVEAVNPVGEVDMRPRNAAINRVIIDEEPEVRFAPARPAPNINAALRQAVQEMGERALGHHQDRPIPIDVWHHHDRAAAGQAPQEDGEAF